MTRPLITTGGAGRTGANETDARLWSLTSLDAEVDTEILGQYPVEFREIRASRLDEQETAGPQAGVVLSAGTGVLGFRGDTEFRSMHYDDDVEPILARWRALRDEDPRLGRHVRVRLVAPSIVCEGKVRNVEIQIGTAWVTGRIRYFRVSFEVVDDGGGEIVLETEAPTVRETSYVTLGDRETFEHLARRLLGDPERSPLIRFINPEIANDDPGGGNGGNTTPVTVRVFEPEHPLMRRPVRPFSLALGAREDYPAAFAARLREIVEERGQVGASRSIAELDPTGDYGLRDLLAGVVRGVNA